MRKDVCEIVFTTAYKMKVAVVLLAFGFACVSAGSYGGQGHGMGYQHYAQYVQPQYIQPRPQYAQVQYYQPVGANVGGSGSGNLLGGSGSLGGGYGGGIGGGIGGGSGAIIPIIIIFVLLAIFAPVLIGSLVSSNDALFDSLGSN
uniref:Uncharacterized protein n=2 Tax=Magallana gigas TaxID=29159 RepID=A0A8W8HXU3_MAGGI